MKIEPQSFLIVAKMRYVAGVGREELGKFLQEEFPLGNICRRVIQIAENPHCFCWRNVVHGFTDFA